MASDSSSSTKATFQASTSVVKRLTQWRFSGLQENYQREVMLVLACAVSVYCLVALFSFSPIDPSPVSISLPSHEIVNRGGVVGAYLAGSLFYYWGVLAILLPLPLLTMVIAQLLRRPYSSIRERLLGWVSLFTSLSAMLHRTVVDISYEGLNFPIAGQVGELSSTIVSQIIGTLGHDILMTSLFICGLLMIIKRPLVLPTLKIIFYPALWLGSKLHSQYSKLFAKLSWPKSLRLWSRSSSRQKNDEVCSLIIPGQEQAIKPSQPANSEPLAFTEPSIGLIENIDVQIEEDAKEVTKSKPYTEEEPQKPETEHTGDFKPKSYQPPPLQIFRSQEGTLKWSAAQQKEFEKTADLLIKILADFHIEGQIVAIQPGPVVTVYEFQPKAGTKLSKVTGLMEDIALALKVDSIFIHPVSGKRALGIQVPNQQRSTVYLGDILKSDAFQKASSPLTFAMGQSLNGDPICEDLAAMPHLLTAGQTGSGKSVAINTLLCSIILKAKPDEVKMILVDPKILELKVYEGIPHLLMPVITEASKASLALKWACHEMDRRYQIMEVARVRHITGFNQFWESASQAEREEILRQTERESIEKLPYIVIVIDELADLMLTAPKDVESSIQRLAQKARACGIHLVLATQRPSVDVITGVIKANLPCRSSFKVFSRADSRTILDCIGAEKLLGKGDMLFLKPGSSRLQRIQGAFLDDAEVVKMVESIQADSEPEYDEEAISWIEAEFRRSSQSSERSATGSLGDEMDDPKWDEALQIAQSQGHISASYLQRSLKIGYNRAARIVEAMEQQGLVGEADGSKPRKWLGLSPSG